MVKTIGVIGGGVVGKAVSRSYLEWAEVRLHDVIRERSTHALKDALACDIIFVCLPTPRNDDGSCDLRDVEGFFESQRDSRANFVLKSTVPIGTTERLVEKYNLPNLVHSPEFLTARCADTDAQIPARNIIGITHPDGPMLGNRCSKVVYDIYRKRFPSTQVYLMTSNESEAVKLFTNAFFAVKIAFFNEIEELVQELNLNWQVVLDGILSDGRIAHSHTRVPGPDGKRGFGGVCLEKDLANLITTRSSITCGMPVCCAAIDRNLFDRKR